jgi:hypothetical protein
MRATVAAAVIALVMATAGCGSSHPPLAAHASASPTPGTLTLPEGRRRALAAEYLAIANPANRQLDRAVDQFGDHAHDDLTAAASDLMNHASIERQWDRQLLRIGFPGELKPVVSRLVQANEARADLALREAKSSSLAELGTFGPAHAAADAKVEQQVRVIRHDLGLPPPDES